MNETNCQTSATSELISDNSSQQELTLLQQAQLKREKRLRDEAIGKVQRSDTDLYQQNRGAQTTTAMAIRKLLVPAAAYWLEKHVESATRRTRNVGVAVAEFKRIAQWVDAHCIAHIGLSVVLDSIGRGQTFKTPINTLQVNIGRQIEDQAMISYVADADPSYFAKLQKYYLNDPVRRYDSKIKAMRYSINKDENLTWQYLSEEDLIRVGALVLKAIMSVPVDNETKEGFFETKKLWVSKLKEVRYLGYSFTGIKFRDVLQEMADANIFNAQPMVCEPMPWSLTERGGYLLPPPQPWGNLIHSCNPTVPSDEALAALNRLQKQPYRINNYILDVQLELIKTTCEIGGFRSFEKDSWKDIHFPRYSSEYIATLDKDSDEYKKVMKELKEAYHNQKLDEKNSLTPRRLVTMAAGMRDTTFWTPWFYDSRLRLYPICELSITNGDSVRALLTNANPVAITEDTKRELLIAMATSGDFKTSSGAKCSKVDFFSRYEWALDFVQSHEFREVVENPLGTDLWRKADEPFQFLSYCEEYYALFISKERSTTRVWIGRDATCSGIQILSSVIGDEKAMLYTNVTPSDKPMDAYALVAETARKLLRDENWVAVQLQKRKAKDEKWNLMNPDSQREIRNFIDIPIEEIDRSVVKKQVMCTGYGATYRSKYRYILEHLREEKKLDLHPADRSIIVAACVSAMELCFPQYSALNVWMKAVSSAACKAGLPHIKWTSPNGSVIAQDYREPLFVQVKTHAASSGHYGRLVVDQQGTSSVQNGWGDVKDSKHGSAIAANFTHSLDATIVQQGMVNLEDGIDCISCHDCYFFMAGYADKVIPHFRRAFRNVVTTPVLEDLLESNSLEDSVPMLSKNKVDLSDCVNSAYLFC